MILLISLSSTVLAHWSHGWVTWQTARLIDMPIGMGTDLRQCFSTGVLQNVRIPPVASKGSAVSNQVTETKRHLWPLDAFVLLVRLKCICTAGGANAWALGRSYGTPPGLSFGLNHKCPL